MRSSNDPIHEAIFATASHDPQAVRAALDYLLAHPQQSAPALHQALRDMDGNPSWIADLLGRLGDPASVPLLQEKLRIGVHNLRFAAAMALAVHPHPSALTALLECLDCDDPRACGMAAMGLAQRGDDSACAAIAKQLQHPDIDARAPIIEALWELQCIGETELEAIRRDDTDPLIQALIDRLRATTAPQPR